MILLAGILPVEDEILAMKSDETNTGKVTFQCHILIFLSEEQHQRILVENVKGNERQRERERERGNEESCTAEKESE